MVPEAPQPSASRVHATRELRSPVGRLLLTASARGLCSLQIGGAAGSGAATPHPLLDRAAAVLAAYFGGAPLAAVPLDLTGLTPFRRRILETLRDRVAAGTVVTYGELAELAGKPGAARAVGRVMATNPLPIFLPCHRVVSRGGPGGFGPGLDCKRKLLAVEGVKLPR